MVPVGATRRVAPTRVAPTTTSPSPSSPHGPTPGSIGAIIGQFKSITTKRINALRGTPGAPVWQRNYYEHIIRNAAEWQRIRQYIQDNPARWEADGENPANLRPGQTVCSGGRNDVKP